MNSSWINVGDFPIGKDERTAISEVLDTGRITEWKKVREFEENFSDYLGTKYAVLVNSGTSALIAGIMALSFKADSKVKKKTKVITSPITYIATSNAILVQGLEPVYVDIDPTTFCITAENIDSYLATVHDPENHSLILPVHVMGYSCDMDGINNVARKYGLRVFEDAAEALGTSVNGQKVGTFSDISAFSFYIAHNIQAGELGAIATDDNELFKLVKMIKANGRMCDCAVCIRNTDKCPKIFKDEDADLDPRFLHMMPGYNFKTMEFQAALAQVQLAKADWIIKRRRENVKKLNEGLSKYSDILQLPLYSENVSYLAYPLVIKDQNWISRKKLRQSLEGLHIETRPLFGCIPTQQPAYYDLKDQYEGKLPVADHIGMNGLYIGCHQYLSDDDIDRIVWSFREILG